MVMGFDNSICQQVYSVLSSAGIDNYAVMPANGRLFPLMFIFRHAWLLTDTLLENGAGQNIPEDLKNASPQNVMYLSNFTFQIVKYV